jgi:hypothetical protein
LPFAAPGAILPAAAADAIHCHRWNFGTPRDEIMQTLPACYADRVRQSVSATLAELGCDSSVGVEEAILIRQGVYCGRRFRCPGGYAVWFVEENQIKYYGAEGRLERVVAGPGSDDSMPSADSAASGMIVPRRRAA